MALKVYLIRHGETDFNKQDKKWEQSAETSLNEVGIKQSKKLAQRIKRIKFDKLFSSDLKRTLQTAEIVSKALEVSIIKDKRLREYNPNKVDPSSEKWIKEYKRLLNLGMSKYDIRPFGGENIWDLIKRVKSFLNDLEKESGTIAIISHSGVNSTLINLSQRRKKDNFSKIKQDNACINILEFIKGKWIIRAINDSGHISSIKPQKKNYKNQREIRAIAKRDALKKLNSLAKEIKEIYLAGDILTGQFGFYNSPYKRYKGSTIEIYIVPKKSFKIPKEWKISLITSDVKKYEIGEIKINNRKHKINVTIINNSNEINKIKYKTKRIK